MSDAYPLMLGLMRLAYFRVGLPMYGQNQHRNFIVSILTVINSVRHNPITRYYHYGLIVTLTSSYPYLILRHVLRVLGM